MFILAIKQKKVQQPLWKAPAGTEVPKLKLYNSLTKQKVGQSSSFLKVIFIEGQIRVIKIWSEYFYWNAYQVKLFKRKCICWFRFDLCLCKWPSDMSLSFYRTCTLWISFTAKTIEDWIIVSWGLYL